MDVTREPSEDAAQLRDCLDDLVSITALPAKWTGDDPDQVVNTVLDALMRTLRLSFVCVRLNDL